VSAGTVIPAGRVTPVFADAALVTTVVNTAAAAKAAPMRQARRRFVLVIMASSFRSPGDAVCAARIDAYVEERISVRPRAPVTPFRAEHVGPTPRSAIRSLRLSGDESVLEIGFGPGVGVRTLTKRLPRGWVAGIDPSPVMVQQATRRKRAAAERGRVELRTDRLGRSMGGRTIRRGGVGQEWPSLRDDLHEVWRVLRPGGHVAIAVHAWVAKYAKDRGDPDGQWEEHVADALRSTAFADVVIRRGRAMSGRALYLHARKLAAA
jgi:SAM-dependent methyltransferase